MCIIGGLIFGILVMVGIITGAGIFAAILGSVCCSLGDTERAAEALEYTCQHKNG